MIDFGAWENRKVRDDELVAIVRRRDDNMIEESWDCVSQAIFV